jgi:hypothetical protein
LPHITSQQWNEYDEQGFIKLGKVLSDADLKTLQNRIDHIMLGKARVDYTKMLMQLDSDSGKYEDAPEQSKGFKGATLDYRKIQELEFDPIFLAFMQRPIFKEICDHVLGEQTPVSCFRAMFMNKPARKGTFLPFHQDRWDFLDRDPLITLWTALDPATVGNGCVQVVPGTHKLGLVNPSHGSGFLTQEQADKLCPVEKRVFLELQPGESMLLHNWLIHGSDRNNTDVSRRAFSVCYMDAATHVTKTGQKFPVIFGPGALVPEAVATV